MALETRVFSTQEVSEAADLLQRGGILAFATETVYGLGADACNGAAVAAVYAAKGRPAFNPLIIHFAEQAAAERYAHFPPLARKLAAAFWPGPLSLVLPVRAEAGLSSLVTAGLDTVAVRVPAHPVARALLAAFDGPVAAPSANQSGSISPTQPGHVLAGLAGRIDGVLDGGHCAVGLESTIVLVEGANPALLRAGGVTVEDIEAVLGKPLSRPEDPATPKSPGQLASHYAPDAPVRINAVSARPDEVLIGFGPAQDAPLNLSPKGDLAEAAANLFALLRDADTLAEAEGKTIAVSPIPDEGLGLAINDRLSRAAADREAG